MKPTLQMDEYGNKYWYLNEKFHREDGPALITSNGDKYWYFNGNLHRGDGPAVIYASGKRWWYIHGQELTPPDIETIKALL